MPDEKPRATRRATPPPIQSERDLNERRGVAKDVELLEAAGGARPSPEPAPRPTGPVNRGADLTGDIVELKESQREVPPAPPPPPPPNESEGGEDR